MLKVWFPALSFALISHPCTLRHVSPPTRTARLFFTKQTPTLQKEREKHFFKKGKVQKRLLFAHFQNWEGKTQFKYWQLQLFYPNMLSGLMINDVPLCFFWGVICLFACLLVLVMKELANELPQHSRCKTRHVYLDCPIYLLASVQGTQKAHPSIRSCSHDLTTQKKKPLVLTDAV